MKRNATAVWNGSGLEGSGHLTTQSGVLNQQPYSTKMRFENEDGRAGTNPEELIAAAHAGCFTMALSFALANNGTPADELETKAVITLEAAKEGKGHDVTKSALTLKGKVPDIDAAKFKELAEGAKKNCPISKLLNCEITLDASLA